MREGRSPLKFQLGSGNLIKGKNVLDIFNFKTMLVVISNYGRVIKIYVYYVVYYVVYLYILIYPFTCITHYQRQLDISES